MYNNAKYYIGNNLIYYQRLFLSRLNVCDLVVYCILLLYRIVKLDQYKHLHGKYRNLTMYKWVSFTQLLKCALNKVIEVLNRFSFVTLEQVVCLMKHNSECQVQLFDA